LLHCFFIHDTHIVYSNKPSLTFWKINMGKNVIISENVIPWEHFFLPRKLALGSFQIFFFCTDNSSSELSYSILRTILKTQFHLDIEKAKWKNVISSRLDRSLT
jgi:hypothetical protein